MLAHEINNLMQPVLCRSQLAQRFPENQKLVQDALEASIACAEQASAMAIVLLEEASGAAQGASDLLEDVIDRARLLWIPLDEHRVEIDLGNAAGSCVPRSILVQVLVNLLKNASAALRRVGGPGSIRIESTLVLEEPGSTWNGPAVLIRVMDTGPGLSDSAHNGASQSGYGLGLRICEQLLSPIGGQCRVQNRDDAPGAVATVLIPCGLTQSQAA